VLHEKGGSRRQADYALGLAVQRGFEFQNDRNAFHTRKVIEEEEEGFERRTSSLDCDFPANLHLKRALTQEDQTSASVRSRVMCVWEILFGARSSSRAASPAATAPKSMIDIGEKSLGKERERYLFLPR